jgi:hypothetical protein
MIFHIWNTSLVISADALQCRNKQSTTECGALSFKEKLDELDRLVAQLVKKSNEEAMSAFIHHDYTGLLKLIRKKEGDLRFLSHNNIREVNE